MLGKALVSRPISKIERFLLRYSRCGSMTLSKFGTPDARAYTALNGAGSDAAKNVAPNATGLR